MALIFSEVEALAFEVKKSVPCDAIIGVDGWTGVGKTTLATALAGAGWQLQGFLQLRLCIHAGMCPRVEGMKRTRCE